MHARVRKHDEDGAKDGEANGVAPESHDIETETAQDGGAGHLDVETVLVVDERQVLDFVDDEAFEAVVEDGKL